MAILLGGSLGAGMPHGAERGPLKGMERTCVRCSGLLWLRLFGHCKGGAGSAKKGTAALRRWGRACLMNSCVTVSQCCGEEFPFPCVRPIHGHQPKKEHLL